ncbi:hypothetical protein [Ideonella sp. B508-1]|uniref:hypothetical protein n=1 Tax=Ideonella sp. B508-1 TaxID=137716 RepID=UPI0011D2620E|nr:hypothetical protein [Ideonella sp. B508-1]
MNLLLIGALAALPFCGAHAGVSIESACYQSESSHGAAGKASAFFRFKSYRDDDAQKYIGGIVNYKNSKSSIPVVYDDEVQAGEGSSGSFQRTWLEIINRKIVGQYVEYGGYDGNPGGRYIKYTGFKDNRVVVFRVVMNDAPCSGD